MIGKKAPISVQANESFVFYHKIKVAGAEYS